jgi:hypothetical protein
VVVAHPVAAMFGDLLDRVDQTLNSYKSDRNIGKVFKQIFVHASKFCLSCELFLTNATPQTAAELLAKTDQPREA